MLNLHPQLFDGLFMLFYDILILLEYIILMF